MRWLVPAGIIAFSYFEIRGALPEIAARAPNAGVAGAAAAALWISLFVEILVTGVLLLVPWIGRGFPAAVHFGSRRLSDYTLAQRERILPLLRNMAVLMAAECNAFSGIGIHMRIEAALKDPRHQPPNLWWAGGMLISFAATTYYYLQRFDEVAGEE